MSMDLDFWKYKKGVSHDDKHVYESACCDGDIVASVEDLPIDAIQQKIAEVFSDWTQLDTNHYLKEGEGEFEIFTTKQIVRFDCSYKTSHETLNQLINIMNEFGCPLYDPQVSTRFDTWTEN